MTRHQSSFTIRFYEAGPDGLASLPTIANLFQQAAGDHADTLGLSQHHLAAHGLGWVMSRLTWQITRLPHPGDDVIVETWPSSTARGLFNRQYRLLDAENTVLVAASSVWLAFDINARKRGHIPADLTGAIPFDDNIVTAPRPRALPRLQNPAHTCTIIPRHSDLDVNGHVNNAQLVAWLLESAPRHDLSGLKLLDIQFRRECGINIMVTSQTSETGPEHLNHRLIRTENGIETEIARAETHWES